MILMHVIKVKKNLQKNNTMLQHLQSFFRKKYQLSVIFFLLFVAYFYIKNLTRDIYSGDLGDLVTAAYVFGVPHPSGYPLFTFLGFILSHIPFPLPIVSRVGLISVAASLLGLSVYYVFAYKVTKHIYLSLLSTAVLAFSYYYWLFSEIPEVFALNNAFAIIIFYTTYMFYTTKRISYLYLTVFFSSLALSHHQTIILMMPGVILLLLCRISIIFSSLKRVAKLISVFLLGFFPYIYIPIAASRN